MAIPLTAIPSTPAITPSASTFGAERAAGPSASGFGESLARLIESAEASSNTANSAVANMVDGSGDVHDAMIALQRAELSLQLTVQVRNKLVQAYQDIMRMPVPDGGRQPHGAVSARGVCHYRRRRDWQHDDRPPPAILKRLAGQLKGLIAAPSGKADHAELLAMMYQIFKAAQQSGVMALEPHFEKPETSAIMSKYPKFLARHHAVDFLADSVKVIIIGGIGPHDFENLMDLDLEVRHHEALQPAATLNKVSDAMPGLGIVAAVLGVVITMGVIDGPPAEIGHKVGAALVGTFLGILMSYGFLGPMATNMELKVNAEGAYEQCIKSGLLAMYKGFSPMVAIEFARRVLPEEVRPDFDETEKLCKAAKNDAAAAAAA